MRISPMVVAASMLPSTAHAQLGFIPPQPLRPLDQRVLDVHNRERTALGVPPLRWNAGLAARAQDYANQLARTGQLAHASRTGRGIERENLNQGLPGWNTDQMMGNWLKEKRNFTPGTFPNVSRTGNWYDVGHYSQMIWPSTTDIGCGIAQGRRSKWLVCRYSPGGNKDGKPVGMAVYRAPGGTKGPIDSAKSRQRLGTPGQSHSRPYLETLCASSGKELRSLRTKLEELNARRSNLAAEMRRVQNAIGAAQAGLDDYDPSLLEQLLGTAQAPSNEKMAALSRRLAELQEEWRSTEAEFKALLAQLQKIQTGSGICGRGGEREDIEEDRRPY